MTRSNTFLTAVQATLREAMKRSGDIARARAAREADLISSEPVKLDTGRASQRRDSAHIFNDAYHLGGQS